MQPKQSLFISFIYILTGTCMWSEGVIMYLYNDRKITMNLRHFLLSILIFVFIPKTFAQRGIELPGDTTKQSGITYAIIIGISQYKVVPSLQYAHKDAQAFEDFLLSDAGGNIPRGNIETFLNENATRNNVADAISIIARKAKPGDRVYFFFAGHGDMEDLTQIENGLLLLHNSPNGNYFGMKDDVLEILDLKRYLSPLAERGVEMIFIVDACHSGNLNGGIKGIERTASALSASWGKEYKILSCQPNQLSLESAEWGGGRGLFALQLEEGMKGLADRNNDGKVSFSELERYIRDNVETFSEDKQIPMIIGDLSKPFIKVNPAVLTALKIQKAKDRPALAMVNPKGTEEKYVDSLNPAGKSVYQSFKRNLAENKLIWPLDTNALKDYRLFENNYSENPLTPIMRRNLAAALNQRFDSIVSPLLKGETSYSTRDICYYAMLELDSCMRLLGDKHYMYQNLKARMLYMKAMSYTWGLSEAEYNFTWRTTILESTKLLEESVALEPNASYTLSALGIHYTYLYEYEKANKAFEKFLELQPYNTLAKYSLAQIYAKMKQFDKAEQILEDLQKQFPENGEIKLQLADTYWNNNKTEKSLAVINGMIDSDNNKVTGYFSKGLYYARSSRKDSAIFYYKLTMSKAPEYASLCENNLGHIYFVNNEIDSARKYFQLVLTRDSTYSYAHFNLGVIEEKEDNLSAAIQRFYSTILYASGTAEGFITNLQLYFGKTYTISDNTAFEKFKKQNFTFNMQYVSYLSMMYTYIRVPGLIDSTAIVNYLFDQLSNYKQHEAITWYHHACYLSMKKDKPGALESLEKALVKGFGNYFQFAYDKDLDFIRNTPEYNALSKKYFPDEWQTKK